MLSILPYTSVKKYETSTRKAQCYANELFVISKAENNEIFFSLNLLNVQIKQQKEHIIRNYKLSTYISDQVSGYFRQALEKIDIICYDRKMYVLENLRRCVLYRYHFYLNHPGASRPAKKLEKYVLRKELSYKQTCMLIRARYINSLKTERLFMDICHLRILHNSNCGIQCIWT